ncbi:hypothetical protein FE392_16000, partial [Xenorhabdus sp. 12]
FSVLLYSLLLPMASMNAFSEEERTFEGKAASETWLNSTAAPTTEKDNAGVIAQNIQRVSNLLSSSPAELTEQAKSYALGQVNNTLASRAHDWLSQFGTARINFALDRKGKWDNSAVDLLLPLYDNKTNWLAFTQLGYRHKDSRHTLNLGVGARYFTPSWMYGINTFFDNDVTGKNKRVGVGGEAWTDYVKLSANTYWRVTEWHNSLKGKGIEYEERPANGFDLNGEFYLPSYPNLGGRLGYEQYFGDNVALFNRETTQKNPGLARIGVNYTPVPLVTMGVDYKYGNGGKSETLFQANLNYRFGTPFEAQITPHNVDSMRTLAGSRYDLVERNNDIVLDYRKKPEFNITLPNLLSGYSAQSMHTNATVISERSVKPINWQVDKQFFDNGGKISPQGNRVGLVLPTYNTAADAINDYTLRANADSEDGRQRATQMKVTVEPFIVKSHSIKPATDGPMIANGKSAYNLAAVITHSTPHNIPLKDHTFSNVKWYLKPKNDNATLTWDKAGRTNGEGQLTATLTSTSPLHKDTQIYLVMDGMRDAKIGGEGSGDGGGGTVNFDSVKFDNEMHQDPAGPLKGNGSDTYTFKVKVLDAQNNPVRNQVISGVTWKIKDNRGAKDQLTLVTPENAKTDGEGNLVAHLTSHYGFDEVIVEATLNSATDNSSTDKPSTNVIKTLTSNPVKFETVSQEAGILLQSAIAPNFKLEFPPEMQQRPHNIHEQLEVYLTRKLPGETTASPIKKDAAGSSEHIQFSPANSTQNPLIIHENGKITFPLPVWITEFKQPPPVTEVTADITDTATGAKSKYTYNFKPQQFYYNPNIFQETYIGFKNNKGGQNINPSKTCLNQIYYADKPEYTVFIDPVYTSLRDLFDEYGSGKYGAADPYLGIFNNSTHSSNYINFMGTPTNTLEPEYSYFLLFDYTTNSVIPRTNLAPPDLNAEETRMYNLNQPPYRKLTKKEMEEGYEQGDIRNPYHIENGKDVLKGHVLCLLKLVDY